VKNIERTEKESSWRQIGTSEVIAEIEEEKPSRISQSSDITEIPFEEKKTHLSSQVTDISSEDELQSLPSLETVTSVEQQEKDKENQEINIHSEEDYSIPSEKLSENPQDKIVTRTKELDSIKTKTSPEDVGSATITQ